MASTGLVLVLFVLGHMLGNLQFFMGPEVINAYAYSLKHLPGDPVSLWALRFFLAASLVVHVWMAIALTVENKAARGPEAYAQRQTHVASYAARTMPITGAILLAFIVLHILQFTVRVVPEHYNETIGQASIDVGSLQLATFDVFAMMVAGFSKPLFALIYIFAVALLCLHLSHGVSSLFQSFGLRNEAWRKRLGLLARCYGWFVFLGFASIPFSVITFGYGKAYLAEQQQQWTESSQANAPQGIVEATP